MSILSQRRGTMAPHAAAVGYTFPQNTTVLDNFNRADEGPPLSANWDEPVGHLQVVSNQAKSTTDGGTRWNVTSFNADQEAWVTIATKVGTGNWFGLFLRHTLASYTGYICYVVDNAGTDTWRIYKRSSGVETEIGTATTGPEVTAGDKIGASVIGSTIKMYLFTGGSWSTVKTETDSTFTGAGYIGVYQDGTTGRLDDFGGGSIV